MLRKRWLCLGWLLFLLAFTPVSFADKPSWHSIASPKAIAQTKSGIAQQQEGLLSYFLSQSLHGQGKKDFQKVVKSVENTIGWRNNKGGNIYKEGFKRSISFVKGMDLQGIPLSIMLIPILESQWQPKQGKPSEDYGYWQLTPDILKEIQQLEHVPATVRKGSLNAVRESPWLSTKAAQTHLARYYFYFKRVAKYSESDAWLFTFVSYNWGAGNVKRLLIEVKKDGLKSDFANFYHALYEKQKKNPDDISMRAGLEYLPKLWNIAQLVR